MENNSIEQSKNDESKPRRGPGGYRPGSGRKKGSRDQVSISSLLAQLEQQTGGQHYEELLVSDFLTARSAGDNNLTMKYHHLILNKVMSSLSKIEVTDSEEAIEAKKSAFAAALSRLTGVDTDK